MDFQSENLVVDWISFNIKDLTNPKSIATYWNPLGLTRFSKMLLIKKVNL